MHYTYAVFDLEATKQNFCSVAEKFERMGVLPCQNEKKLKSISISCTYNHLGIIFLLLKFHLIFIQFPNAFFKCKMVFQVKKKFEMNYQNTPAFLKETFHTEDE